MSDCKLGRGNNICLCLAVGVALHWTASRNVQGSSGNASPELTSAVTTPVLSPISDVPSACTG